MDDRHKLIYACADGDLDEATRLLSIGLDVNTVDDNGYSLLWLASYRNQSKIVQHLLTFPDIDVNQQDGHGNTPLYASLIGGQYHCAQLLLNDQRTDVTLIQDDSFTFRNCPTKKDFQPIVSILTRLPSLRQIKFV